ncbi:MAG: DUF3822 family protein [Amoebophilaceae bacterium]|nr:DUF3822 family protein [Amoebophilaceae bacterium]
MLPKKILSVVATHTFNLDKSHQYHLSITISHGMVKICCIEHETKNCLLLAAYEMALDKNQASYIKQLEQIYNEDYFLIKKNWHAVTLSISNQKFTLVPDLLLNKNQLPIYMHVACGLDVKDEVRSFTHVLAKMSLVFAENAAVLDWFKQRYTDSNFHIIHQASAIIEGMHLEHPVIHKTLLFVWLDQHYLHIIARNKANLLYYNAFAYETCHDFLSRLKAVMDILGLKHNGCDLLISGFIEAKSLAYRQLKNYIPQAKLKTKICLLDPKTKIFKKVGSAPMLYFDVISSFFCHPYVSYSKY